MQGRVEQAETREQKNRAEKRVEQRTRTVVVKAVRGHKFSELTIRLATVTYSNVGCGLRSVVKLLEIIDECFNGVFEGELPSHNEISNWALKNGLTSYLDSGKCLSDKEYCGIVHESISVGSQKLMVTLAAPAEPSGHPLGLEDVEVLGLAVAPSWDGDAVEKEVTRCSEKAGHAPE